MSLKSTSLPQWPKTGTWPECGPALLLGAVPIYRRKGKAAVLPSLGGDLLGLRAHPALHRRTKSSYQYTTDKEHLASTHRSRAEWTLERFTAWTEGIHEDVRLSILKVLDRKQHPGQAYKSCMGILSFEKKVGHERLVKACQRALGYGAYNYKTIQKILELELDQKEAPEEGDQLPMPLHAGIRGGEYYR